LDSKVQKRLNSEVKQKWFAGAGVSDFFQFLVPWAEYNTLQIEFVSLLILRATIFHSDLSNRGSLSNG
jgi:hypothetical protein